MTTVVVTETAQYYGTGQTNVVTTGSYRWRFEPQSRTMTAAAFIFMCGGMELALGLGWNINTFVLTTRHFQFCWFIGVIIGSILAVPFISFLPKRVYYLTSALFVLASGIIFVSVPYNYTDIIAARYLSGIGVGLCTVVFIVHGSEIGSPLFRGALLSLEQLAVTFGIAIQVIYASQWTPDIDFAANRLHGIFMIVFAIVAIGILPVVIESPIFYIRRGDNDSALESLRLLEQPQIVTSATRIALDELSYYVTQEENQSIMESLRKSMWPIVKMLLFRSIIALTFSYPLSGALIISSAISLESLYSWPPIIYGALRLLGALIALFLADRLGRKAVPLFSLLCFGGLTIGFGVILSKSSNIFNDYQMSILVTLLLIAQFFSGLFTPTSSVYLGEAFSLNLKPYMVALCVCVQQVVQIVTIVTYVFTMHNIFVYFITVAFITVVLFLYFCAAMPETRRTTLGEAKNRFRNIFYLKFY